MPDGTLNPDLSRYLSEASALNALWLKVSLGHFSDKQPLEALRALLDESGMTLVVENDQTDCGQLAPMQRFKAACRVMALPVTLTFDMGNWLWVGDSPEEAARQLAPAVSYIHVKAAVPHKAQFRAVAPDQTDSRWRDLLNQLPADAPRGIEFPLEGTDLTAVTRHYVNLLREGVNHAQDAGRYHYRRGHGDVCRHRNGRAERSGALYQTRGRRRIECRYRPCAAGAECRLGEPRGQ